MGVLRGDLPQVRGKASHPQLEKGISLSQELAGIGHREGPERLRVSTESNLFCPDITGSSTRGWQWSASGHIMEQSVLRRRDGRSQESYSQPLPGPTRIIRAKGYLSLLCVAYCARNLTSIQYRNIDTYMSLQPFYDLGTMMVSSPEWRKSLLNRGHGDAQR